MEVKDLVRDKVLVEMIVEYAGIILAQQQVINEAQQEVVRLTKAATLVPVPVPDTGKEGKEVKPE